MRMLKKTGTVGFVLLVLSICCIWQTASAAETWIGTWASGQQLTESQNNPPSPYLANNTLRQVVHATLGGSRIRVQFSNKYSSGPVTINSAHIAVSTSGSAINTSTDTALTFGGSASVTISAGQEIYSDAVNFNVTPLSNLAVSIYFGSASSTSVTGHPGSRMTSYIQTGNAVSAASLPSAATTEHWYILSRIDLWLDDSYGCVVTLGDSITDGRGSTTNGNNRWPDNLASRLHADPDTIKVGVINQGIGGNCVVSGGLGPTAVARFDHDVVGQPGVKWVIILEGVNDIGGNQTAANLTNAFQQFVNKAHAANILAYGVPILPFGGSSYDTTAHRSVRTSVNNWIRTSGQFDAVIDLDAAVRDPANPERLLAAYDSGDHLHLNVAGYQQMANAINLDLFTQVAENPPGQASNPSPANGATSVSTTADLSWTAGSGATSHDVYFGTSSPGTFRGNQTGTTYDTGTMSNSTTYYWRIDEKNDYGTTTGAVWSFTTAASGTPPGQASNPSPSNGAANVGTTTDLSWTAGSGATSHDVYFGTSSPGTFRGNQTSTTYDTGTMTAGTTYYWRIDEKNAYGTTTGTVWSFTTTSGGSSVGLLGTWVTGTSHTKESGSNRALIFIAHAESTSTINLSSVTYGGQAMTKVVDYSYNAASGYAYAAAFILKESGVAAASGSTFTVTWGGTAPGAAGYSSVFLANVNQTTATGATGNGGRTSNPVTTSALATSSGDMVLLGATCGNAGSYTLNNSFIEGNDQQIGGTVTGVTGRKSATGANETPSATYSSTINRQMIIGLVVKHQ
jgi:lysophospholipase L1-like esterase